MPAGAGEAAIPHREGVNVLSSAPPDDGGSGLNEGGELASQEGTDAAAAAKDIWRDEATARLLRRWGTFHNVDLSTASTLVGSRAQRPENQGSEPVPIPSEEDIWDAETQIGDVEQTSVQPMEPPPRSSPAKQARTPTLDPDTVKQDRSNATTSPPGSSNAGIQSPHDLPSPASPRTGISATGATADEKPLGQAVTLESASAGTRGPPKSSLMSDRHEDSPQKPLDGPESSRAAAMATTAEKRPSPRKGSGQPSLPPRKPNVPVNGFKLPAGAVIKKKKKRMG